MTCAPDVAILVHNRAKTFEEFNNALEGIRTYVLTRNQGNSFSKKLADANWREKQTRDLFQKMQDGKPFEALLDEPLLRKMVKRNGKNEANLSFILHHITPCFLQAINAKPTEKLTSWALSLNAAFIDPINLQHQVEISKALPPEHSEKLVHGKQTISMGVWKRASDGEFTQNDILNIVALVNNGLKEIKAVAPSYFAVRAFSMELSKESKAALLMNLQGVAEFHKVVMRQEQVKIESIAAEYRKCCSLFWFDETSAPMILKSLEDMVQPTKRQWIEYYAFQYLRMIHENAPYQSLYHESIAFGLQKLSQDPRIVKGEIKNGPGP